MQLYQRVEKIARELTKSIPDLAEKIGIKYPTFRGYLNAEREDNLWPQLPKILAVCPAVNDIWLYLGRGPMLKSEAAAPPLSVANAAGQYTGDLLDAALGFLRLSPEQASSALEWDIAEMQRLLESRELPSFAQLEKLHTTLGINPAYFFDGDERRMHRPKDALLQVFYALGKRYAEPDEYELAEIFDVDENAAKKFLAEWRTARKEKRHLCLPKEWVIHLEEQYRFHTGWLADGTPPVIQKAEKVEPRRAANNEVGDAKTPPTPHIDVRLLQKAIELIDSSMESWNRSLSPGDKATLFAQSYEKLLEEGEDSVSIQRMKLIIELLTKVPG